MDYNLIILILLICLATGDLIVGVANDAINFLNSAIGSKVAPFKIIMLIAALGMIAGVTFSSGMMEIARKGIVNPEYFLLGEILIIFIAYALGDIIVIDFYNTFGLPTSTTVSMIFGLFGGALAIVFIKISEGVYTFANFGVYLNIDNIFKFVTAILISIVLSFILGSLVQYLSRLLFSFDYVNRFKKYGSLWAGLVLTSISYFIIIKGFGGSLFATPEILDLIKHNIGLIIIGMIVSFTLIIQLFLMFTKVNVLKIIVLIGTFSLAMAFAANDLVNFLGVPLAGISAYNFANQFPDPTIVRLTELTKPFVADTYILLIAGVVMIATLYLSKKSRTVSKTEVSLGSQEEAVERFDTFVLARGLVRSFIGFVSFLKKITPKQMQKFVKSRFDRSKAQVVYPKGEAPAFDLIRASVNLMVASALISFGTSLKLPLSTTYVTFIVAMSTALADRAWGRESAVYRVSGVLTVIGGWFITALVATTVAGIIATSIYYGGMIAVIGLFLLSGFLIFRTNLIHKKREKQFSEREQVLLNKTGETVQDSADILFENTSNFYLISKEAFGFVFEGIATENLKKLKKAKNQHKKLKEISNNLISDIIKVIKTGDKEINKNGNLIAKSIGSLERIDDNFKEFSVNIYKHFDNNHQGFGNSKNKNLFEVNGYITTILDSLSTIFKNLDFQYLEETNRKVESLGAKIRKFQSENIIEISVSKEKLRTQMLYLSILNNTQIIIDEILIFTKAIAYLYDTMENKKNKK